MVKYLIIISFIFLQGNNYPSIFKDDYDIALAFIEDNADAFTTSSKIFQSDEDILKAIVFPELIRYSLIRDFLESNSLEIVYVNTGMADFSIGYLQIKPSFAVKLENYIFNENHYLNKYKDYFIYNVTSIIEERKERLHRLKNLEFQLLYLNVFYELINMRFPELKNENIEFRIKFLSTAYNSDFEASKESLINNISKEFFPWGPHNDKVKYNYADISWDYYRRVILLRSN